MKRARHAQKTDRGKKRCPTCLRKSLVLYETLERDLPASRGTVLTIRRRYCETPDCLTNGAPTWVEQYDVSVGTTKPGAIRCNSGHRGGEPRYIVVKDGDGDVLFRIRVGKEA